MDKIKSAFSGKKANIGYIVGGYPSLEITRNLLLNLDKTKLDLLEIGIPYSDPLADGKFIADASFKTVLNGISTSTIFELLQNIKGSINKPIVFLVYFNLIFSYGLENFVKKCKEVGISGIIVPDLPFEECEELVKICAKYNIAFVPLISVTSDENRIKKLISIGSGFIYALGAIGVSGSKSVSVDRIKSLVNTAKNFSHLPVAVGFGVRNKSDSDTMKEFADGAIIGTQIVKLSGEYKNEDLIEQINKLF